MVIFLSLKSRLKNKIILCQGSNGQHSRRASHALYPDAHGAAVPSITCTRAETHELTSSSGATSHRRLSEHPTPGKLPKRPRARSTTIELAHKVCTFVSV